VQKLHWRVCQGQDVLGQVLDRFHRTSCWGHACEAGEIHGIFPRCELHVGRANVGKSLGERGIMHSLVRLSFGRKQMRYITGDAEIALVVRHKIGREGGGGLMMGQRGQEKWTWAMNMARRTSSGGRMASCLGMVLRLSARAVTGRRVVSTLAAVDVCPAQAADEGREGV